VRIFYYLFLVSVMSLTSGGCKVNQEKEQAYYQEVLRSKNAKAPQPLEPNQPLTLIDALKMANWHNEQLAIKGEQYLQALINKDRAASNFLPQIAFIPTYTEQEKIKLAGPSSIASEFVLPHTFDQPINAEIDLNLPRDLANVKRADSTAQQQRSLLLDLKSTILLDVARVYYQVLLSESKVSVLENSVAVQNDRVTNIQNKYEAGTARKLDVVQAEGQLSQTKVTLIKAKNDVSTGRATLAFLISTSMLDNPLSDQLNPPAQLPPNEQLLSTAWLYREDLKAAAHQVEASIHFNLPVFSAGLIHDDVRTAWSMLRQAKLNESYIQRQVKNELTVAVENYNDITKETDELEVLVKAAKEELQRSEYAYNAGLATYLDTLIARDQFLTAQLSLKAARFNEKIYFLNLMRILGHFDAESLESGFVEQLTNDTATVASSQKELVIQTESKK
jgi:outer membrane protein TolC